MNWIPFPDPAPALAEPAPCTAEPAPCTAEPAATAAEPTPVIHKPFKPLSPPNNFFWGTRRGRPWPMTSRGRPRLQTRHEGRGPSTALETSAPACTTAPACRSPGHPPPPPRSFI
ncbi:hypothetical protein DPX16_16604 [Anabarilius grahami]|uniref:Uncharacterized protein n=1 Tax=Anabarilius grahami TaxID=495550 RepID=A0A3N0XV59_ANAGA|nr:hypothetical protein DPX16_16604 [Anabarilius grahami]